MSIPKEFDKYKYTYVIPIRTMTHSPTTIYDVNNEIISWLTDNIGHKRMRWKSTLCGFDLLESEDYGIKSIKKYTDREKKARRRIVFIFGTNTEEYMMAFKLRWG